MLCRSPTLTPHEVITRLALIGEPLNEGKNSRASAETTELPVGAMTRQGSS
jgi:hypothetical protein